LKIRIEGAKEHNLKNVDVTIHNGLTVVTGVSGSGKTSLVFDTLFHEARRRYQEVFAFGTPGNRLKPAKVEAITGLGPAIAIEQNLLNRNPNSTLASASGLHPFFRLLFARFGKRYCRTCGSSLSLLSEDEILDSITELLKKRSYNIYAPVVNRAWGSHSTLISLLTKEFGENALFIDETPWNNRELNPDYPHSIEVYIARLDKESSVPDIRAAVRKVKALGAAAVMLRSLEDKNKHLVYSFLPVCSNCNTWFDSLEPKHFNQSCPSCKGSGCAACNQSGLLPEAAPVTWKDMTFSAFLEKSVLELQGLFANPGLPHSADRLVAEIIARISTLNKVGIGYITLNRPTPSLSRGEAQRVRLAVALAGQLEDILYVLDEPTIGQHPEDVLRLLPAFKDLNGPVVFVEHDRIAAAFADYAIDIGPGAGNQGGEILFAGPPTQLWNTGSPTGKYFSGIEKVPIPISRPQAHSFLQINKTRKHNLLDINVKIPLERLTVITGVSGSGKSTLAEEVLAASLTQGKPVGCESLVSDALPGLKMVIVDQRPIGRNPRSTPATYTKLSDIIRDMFAAVKGQSTSHFSFNRPEGACPTCGGMGALEIRMSFLPSTWISCTDCGGKRFNDEVLDTTIEFGTENLSIADFYDLPVEEALTLLEQVDFNPKKKKEAIAILTALIDVGLGYLTLGQPSPTLSGGEAQRVKIARYLGKKNLAKCMILLDEPTTGLHPQDISGLLVVLERLVKGGATIVVVEHNTDFIRAADWVIDLGPGAGPSGGKVIYQGPASELLQCKESLTAKALLEETTIHSREICNNEYSEISSTPSFQPSSFIRVRGAAANNLKKINVDIPKGSLTVVTGVSGSGKSSLVMDVLEAEARRRYLETLSLYERQGMKEGPEALVESVSGLGVCLTVTPDRKLYDRRSTVGTATEIWHQLAILLSTIGERFCTGCGTKMNKDGSGVGDKQHWICPICSAMIPGVSPAKFSPFNYAAACKTCQGIGTLQVPKPEKLIRNPEKALCAGAMYSPGFFPKGYLCKPGNGGYDIVRAFAARYGFDLAETPWNQLTPDVQQMFFFGDPQPLEVMFCNQKGVTRTEMVKFNGFYGFIRDWDVGGTYTETELCPACGGAKLKPQYLSIMLSGYNMHQLSQMPLTRLLDIMNNNFDSINLTGGNGVSTLRSKEIIRKRLRFLKQVGLGYLHLNRVTATLSAGEAQRVKLAGILGNGLTSLTVLLDEPSRGLHPVEVGALVGVLKELRDEGNTVIIVEHDQEIISAADYLIDFGPLAGTKGGNIVASGSFEEVAKQPTITGAWLRGERKANIPVMRREPGEWMVIAGARENNLQGEAVQIPRGVLAGICGISGSGKSTLLIDTLGRTLVPVKQTTSVAKEPLEPGKHDRISNIPARTIVIDQTRKGIHSPLGFLELSDILAKSFAQSEDAKALGLGEGIFKKKCSVCRGSGRIRQNMGFLPDVFDECETCNGTGYPPEIRDVRCHGYTLPDLNRLTIQEVYHLFGNEEKISLPLKSAVNVGLGYLVLKQPGMSLSGGEAQRLKIAKELCRKTPGETLYILDEPTVGQHLEDVDRLSRVLQRLVEVGNSVIVIEHHPMVLAACDWLIEMGPAGGPDGGRVIASGTPESIARLDTPSAPYIRKILENRYEASID